MLAALLLAVAVSVDGFVAGVAEGMRGIRVPVSSLIVVNLVSAAVLFVSLGSGRLVAGWLNPVAGRLAGGGILICLGAWMLRSGPRDPWRPSRAEAQAGAAAMPGARIRRRGLVSALALVPRFLDDPAEADLDLSGVLTAGEALLLGLALAIDALAVGFGAGMAGLPGGLTPVVASAMQFVFVSMGLALGRRITASALGARLGKAPGGLLILLGVLKLR